MLEVLLFIVANVVIFLVSSWAILSQSIDDGIITKVGLIMTVFASLANIITCNITPSSMIMTLGFALVCGGTFLRLHICPKYLEKICNLDGFYSKISPSHLRRRSTDKVKV